MPTGPETSVTAAPAAAAARRDGMALPAGGAVGDVAHRIDRLVRRAGGDEHALAGERALRARLRRAEEPLERRRRSRAARPCGRGRTRLGHRAVVRADDRDAVARSVARLRCVAGCSHMRTFMAGAIRTGVSVASSTVEARSSASPLRHLGHQVGGRRRDDDQVGVARRAGYGRSRPRRSAVEQVGMRRLSPDKRGGGERRHELLRAPWSGCSAPPAPRSRRRRIRSSDL